MYKKQPDSVFNVPKNNQSLCLMYKKQPDSVSDVKNKQNKVFFMRGLFVLSHFTATALSFLYL